MTVRNLVHLNPSIRTFLFIASKNIFSEGYIQFPLALVPPSFSLFAGFEPSESSSGDARGIVETTRCVPSPVDTAAASAGGVEEKNRENSPGCAGGVWLISSESQALPLLAALALAAPGNDAVGFAFNHAARVLSSTGHTSAGASASGVLPMFVYVSRDSVKRAGRREYGE